MEPKLNLILPSMDSQEVIVLKRALERQKKARQQAERILEQKSNELYQATRHLKETNSKLEHLLIEKTSGLDGVFINIIDPYVVMDLQFNVINMNVSAKEFLGYDHIIENINLSQLVHKDFLVYTAESFQTLIRVGALKNYRAKIVIKDGTEKWVQINASIIFDAKQRPMAAQGIIRDITQEMEVKELLSEQRMQLHIIVENSPLGIVLIKEDKIMKTNSTFAQLLGYTKEELKEVQLSQISASEDEHLSKESSRQMNDDNLETFVVYKKYFKKDGGFLLARTLVNTVKNNSGKIDYRVAMIEDITKEREAQWQLKASENRFKTLISSLHTGILLEDENRKIALTNQNFCSLFGIPVDPEQLIGADCSNAAEQNKVHFKNPEAFVTRIEKVLEERKLVVSDELEMMDGRYLERDYIPIFNNEEYKGHLWTYQDVTLQKTLRKHLETQKEKYSGIIANMNLGLLEVDNNDVIQMANQSFCTMSGFSEAELLGKKAVDILNVNEQAILEEKNKERLEGKSDSYEIQVVHKNGEKRHWLISGGPRYDEADNPIGSIGIHLDITNQKLLEVQKEQLVIELENSNKGLQEYAHIVSHDLKSPLRSISALSSWIQEDYKDVLDASGQKNLQLMQEKVAAMDKLISGILEYSTANSSEIISSIVNLNEVIACIQDTIYIPEHVVISVPKALPTILADSTKMQQLFQNIIANAVVHIDKEKGIVEVLSTEDADQWQFTIKDNGVGIPKAYHQKIFEIFQSIGTKERSTGIGLSIVKKIIDRYGGKIWVDSEMGEGTQFHFTINKTLVAIPTKI